MDPTERRDSLTVGIDLLPTSGIVAKLIARHADVPGIVARRAGDLACAADGGAGWLKVGGRLVYAGSGTSGCLARADAGELSPTYGWPNERLAVLTPGTGAEDSREHGCEVAREAPIRAGDVVLGVSASGCTAFTLGVLEIAQQRGALTVALACNPGTPMIALSDHGIELVVGPEPIAGSTRMRAGLAQKLALTVLSTAIMLRLGRTYDNLMVEVAPSLPKLRVRQERIVAEACGIRPQEARTLLRVADGDVKVAITMSLAPATAQEARTALSGGGGVRGALRTLSPASDRP